MTMPPAPPAAIPQVTPVPGSRLEQLLDMREAAIAAAKEAKDRVEAINKGIMAEVAAAFPKQPVIDIPGTQHRAALRMRYHQGSWYVPAKTLRTRYAGVWNELAKQKKGSWQLDKLGGSVS
jgi:hypothetical protein